MIDGYCQKKYEKSILCNAETILFNHADRDRTHIVNFVVLVAKQYTYACRCKGTEYNMKDLTNLMQMNEKCEYLKAKAIWKDR